MATCTGITRLGDRCKGIAIDSSGYCYAHHPDHVEDRRRAARKGGHRGGRGRPQRETEAIKTLLEDLTDRVLSGDLETGPTAVANQLINTRLRAIEQERKMRELEELEERLEALEEVLKGRKRA